MKDHPEQINFVSRGSTALSQITAINDMIAVIVIGGKFHTVVNVRKLLNPCDILLSQLISTVNGGQYSVAHKLSEIEGYFMEGYLIEGYLCQKTCLVIGYIDSIKPLSNRNQESEKCTK